MEQSIIIQIGQNEFRDIVSEIVSTSVTETLKKLLPEQKKFLTRKEVAEKFHVTLPTIHAWINSGKITAVKMGGRTLFELSEVENAVSPKYKRLQRY